MSRMSFACLISEIVILLARDQICLLNAADRPSQACIYSEVDIVFTRKLFNVMAS